jgi:hypothetical protein
VKLRDLKSGELLEAQVTTSPSGLRVNGAVVLANGEAVDPEGLDVVEITQEEIWQLPPGWPKPSVATVRIDYKASDEAIARVRQAVKQETAANPRWKGILFRFERFDDTYVICDDVDAGSRLLNEVVCPALRSH